MHGKRGRREEGGAKDGGTHGARKANRKQNQTGAKAKTTTTEETAQEINKKQQKGKDKRNQEGRRVTARVLTTPR